jgi:hypothetical protein
MARDPSIRGGDRVAIGGTGSIGRFEIAQKRTYGSYAQAFRKQVKNQQMTAAANAANVMYGAISSQHSGLSQIAVVAATNRAKQEIAKSVLDVLS